MTLHLGARSRQTRPTPGDRIVAALDVGSHKICCLIAELTPVYVAGGPMGVQVRPLGLGHQRSQGIVAGAVVDLKMAQAAVGAAVSQAEHAAGMRIDRVMLAVACGSPRSRTFNGHVDLAEGVARDADIARLDAGARAFAVRDGGALLSLNRIAYTLDTTPAVREPRGLAGHRLEANHHAVTVAPGPLRNLCLLVESCQLELAGLVPAGYASALAATTEAERQVGVVVVDIGAGVASIAGFADGHFIFAAAVPLGGQHVTQEVAHAAALPLAQAERIKTLYGSLTPAASDEHERLPLSDDDGSSRRAGVMTRAQVGRSVAVAMNRVLEGVRQSIDGCSVARIRQASVVITGGASELIGLEAYAAAGLERAVRMAAPPRLDGAAARLSGSASSPAFSCVVGLAMAAEGSWGSIAAFEQARAPRRGYLGRVEAWLRESF